MFLKNIHIVPGCTPTLFTLIWECDPTAQPYGIVLCNGMDSCNVQLTIFSALACVSSPFPPPPPSPDSPSNESKSGISLGTTILIMYDKIYTNQYISVIYIIIPFQI